jgi:hypothetical protein
MNHRQCAPERAAPALAARLHRLRSASENDTVLPAGTTNRRPTCSPSVTMICADDNITMGAAFGFQPNAQDAFFLLRTRNRTRRISHKAGPDAACGSRIWRETAAVSRAEARVGASEVALFPGTSEVMLTTKAAAISAEVATTTRVCTCEENQKDA